MQDLLLGIAIFTISFFSVMSGGIGLLTRPLLILVGIPPEMAMGSFRVANMFGRLASLIPFQRGKVPIDWKLAFLLLIPSFIGGAIGAEIIRQVDPTHLKRLLGIFILAIGMVLLIKKEIGIRDKGHVPTKRKNLIAGFSMILIGIIASFVGGSGIFFIYLAIFLYDKSYITSAPIRKIANFGSALSASLLFIYYGIVDWKLMLVILVADGLGEFLGARYQLKKGERWVRAVTLLVVFASGLTMIFI